LQEKSDAFVLFSVELIQILALIF